MCLILAEILAGSFIHFGSESPFGSKFSKYAIKYLSLYLLAVSHSFSVNIKDNEELLLLTSMNISAEPFIAKISYPTPSRETSCAIQFLFLHHSNTLRSASQPSFCSGLSESTNLRSVGSEFTIQ